MESAFRVCLAAARLGSVCSSRRYRHVSHYNRGPDESATGREAPTGIWSVLTGTYNAASTDANPFPAAPAFPVFTPYSPSTDFTLAALAMNWRPPTTYHYSLGLQSRLPGGAIFDVSYAGARDLHSILGRTINQAALASATNPIRGQTTNTVANIPLRAPYLGWTAEHDVLLWDRWRGLVQLLASIANAEIQTWFSVPGFLHLAAIAEPGTGLHHGVERIRTDRRTDTICALTILDTDRTTMSVRSGLCCPRTTLCQTL